MTEADRAKVDLPDAVVDGFEADELAGEDGAEADGPSVPTEGAVGGDAADLEVIGILELRKPLGKGRGEG